MLNNLSRLMMILGFVLATSIVCLADTTLTITSNFNGTAIGPGRYVYFNSVIDPTGLPAGQTSTITLTNATLSIEGTVYNLPGAIITFDPNVTTATTHFDGSNWITSIPLSLGGNKVLTVYPILFPNGLPGGANPVVFRGTFSCVDGISASVKWAAAVYTQMPSDLNQLGVKVADQQGGAHHAGTPENYTQFVIGGARGGGGSNFTGSYSATGHFSCNGQMTPTPTPSMTPTMTPTTTPTTTPTMTPTPTPGMTPSPTPPEVPEPTTILLFATGLLVGFGVFVFRKFGMRG